jgi:excisionase family DNA binding protein
MAALPRGQQFFTVDEVAELLQVNRRTIINLLASGKLVGFRVGRNWRITREDLERFIEEGKSTDPSGREDPPHAP